jgi:hypothetical protein
MEKKTTRMAKRKNRPVMTPPSFGTKVYDGIASYYWPTGQIWDRRWEFAHTKSLFLATAATEGYCRNRVSYDHITSLLPYCFKIAVSP